MEIILKKQEKITNFRKIIFLFLISYRIKIFLNKKFKKLNKIQNKFFSLIDNFPIIIFF